MYDEDSKRDAHSWYGYLMSEPVQNEFFRIVAARTLAGHPAPAVQEAS